ncbi:MAG TPA: ABC transporter permease [Armatimonadota bacterium]|jgi:simple sugar transport system permease protein
MAEASTPPATPTAARGGTGGGLRSSLKELVWPLVALGGVLLFNLIFSQGFFHIEVKEGHLFGSLIDILNRAAPVMLLGLGMTLVVATGGVDLSVGAVMAISGAVAALLVKQPGMPLAAVLGISLAASLAAGVWNGLLVALLDIQPMVGTLILMVAGRGIAQLITNGQIITFENKPFEFLGGGFLFGLPFTITLVVVFYLVLGYLARRTAFGLFVESVGDNFEASRLAGVNAALVKTVAYTLCGLCAGMAGLIITADIKAADSSNVGMYLELDAILSAVIGGTSLAGGRFNLTGALIGALLIQSLTTTILTRGVPVQFTLVVKAIVIVAVCLIQSDAARKYLLRRQGARV